MEKDLAILIDYNHELFPDKFVEWLQDNHHIFTAFAKQAIDVANKGFRHYSSKTIIEYLRHHTALTESGGEWKINNNYTPYMARLFDLRHPSYAGMFEYRKTNDLHNA